MITIGSDHKIVINEVNNRNELLDRNTVSKDMTLEPHQLHKYKVVDVVWKKNTVLSDVSKNISAKLCSNS